MIAGCRTNPPTANTTAQASPSSSGNSNGAQNSNVTAQPVDANRNAVAAKSDAGANKKNPPAQPLGTYEAREIRDKGIVTLVSKVRTLISFFADGSYTRVSQAGGKTYHSDSGQFHVEAPDKIVLSIQMSSERSRPTIQNPPLQRVHTFSLSSDGEELKLTSPNGSTAVFHKLGNKSSQ